MQAPGNEVLGFWARLMAKNFSIAGNIAQAIVIMALWAAMQKKEEALVKCKDDATVTTERLMNQASLNGMKADNLFERQTLLMERLSQMQTAIKELKERSR